VETERLGVAAAAPRSRIESKRAAAGGWRRETLVALPLMTIRFLHMGSLFKRNPDTWQVIQGQKYKKSSIPG
jgi:hypothetical protein